MTQRMLFALLFASPLLGASPPSQMTALADLSLSALSGETIVRWNHNASMVLTGARPERLTRDLAMVHLAAHDAVNAVRAQYEMYALDRRRMRGASSADPALAAAIAAHDVLAALWPDKQSELAAMIATDIARVNPRRRNASCDIGAAAARAILLVRENDGVDAAVPYMFGPSDPGVYQPVPPLGPVVVGTQLPFMKPFVLDNAAQFRPPPPPDLVSDLWARDYNEVKAVGDVASIVRTAEQTDAARFFFELSTLQWNRTARHVATQYDKGLWRTARAFALMNVSLMDDAIATFESKYYYNFWRPLTAIRTGDDGNPGTDPDPTWAPLGGTPPHPEYLAGHASNSAAAAIPLSAIYGRTVSFSTTSMTSPSQRSYRSFDDMVREIADSRVWAGFHYRFSVDAGLRQGHEVGLYVVQNALRKVVDP
jgi:hypothetical protein